MVIKVINERVYIVNFTAFSLMFACREKTADCKQQGGAAQELMCLCSLAERCCASRPQAGEHPFRSRFECKGKIDKTYTN